MSKQNTIIIFGILVAIMPYLGFPLSWRKGFFLCSGIIITILGYSVGKEIKKLKIEQDNFSSFKDNLNENTNK